MQIQTWPGGPPNFRNLLEGDYEMRLRGEYQHSVDSKSRVSLPAKFRKALPDEVTVVPVSDSDYGKALYVFSEEGYDAWVDSIFNTEEGGYNPRSRKHIALQRYLNASAESVAIDAAGRIKLSSKQCEKVGIVKDVTIIGQGDHIEIWDTVALNDYMESVDPFGDFLEA